MKIDEVANSDKTTKFYSNWEVKKKRTKWKNEAYMLTLI